MTLKSGIGAGVALVLACGLFPARDAPARILRVDACENGQFIYTTSLPILRD
ncbi:hypothetical protein [Pectobacterium araliae]|uniref:hypothetical protein n=1 Tax=Pectobacterium araliae TaxID=3073862 RepID=UPI0021C4AFBF